MTPFTNPLPRANLPRWHESSMQRSQRDGDATGRQWLRARETGAQQHGLVNSVAKIQREIGKIRRRVVGGGSASSTGMVFKGEYNPSKSYTSQNVVAFTHNGGAAGMYIALISVPAGQSPDVGAPYWFAFPNSPAGMWGA